MNKKPAIMSELEAAHEAVRRAQGRVKVAVADARKNGISWAEIGDKLGISKQAAAQKYGEYCRQEIESAARFEASNNSAEVTTLVDDSVAGHSVTPSIFLEPKVPAKDSPAKPLYEPLPDYRNPLCWPESEWKQDDPQHFLVNDEILRPERCPFCRSKSHRSPEMGTWIYEGCTPTWSDPSYYLAVEEPS